MPEQRPPFDGTDFPDKDERPQPPEEPPSRAVHYIVDIVVVLVLGALVFFDKLDVTLVLALIAFIVGAKLPSKGGGVVTMLAPAASFLSNGHWRL